MTDADRQRIAIEDQIFNVEKDKEKKLEKKAELE
jgi:hypothetical protein